LFGMLLFEPYEHLGTTLFFLVAFSVMNLW